MIGGCVPNIPIGWQLARFSAKRRCERSARRAGAFDIIRHAASRRSNPTLDDKIKWCVSPRLSGRTPVARDPRRGLAICLCSRASRGAEPVADRLPLLRLPRRLISWTSSSPRMRWRTRFLSSTMTSRRVLLPVRDGRRRTRHSLWDLQVPRGRPRSPRRTPRSG